MARGGARNRSGPAPVEGSRTSERKGFSLTALPPAGFDGDAPGFPLPRRAVYYFIVEDKSRVRVFDEDATEHVRDRELELWDWAWTTPQACAWSSEQWRWPLVAMWVRTFVVCESSDATAADKGSLHRFADQIGLTPAGLKENGWKIADAPAPAEDDGPSNVTDIKSRLAGGA
jgi:hypothetical protein